MATSDDQRREPVDLPYESTADSAGRRGSDDRRGDVNPADHPAPRSPQPDQEAIRKGEDNLERVKPY
ncbi:MAG: hypothetical protein JO086_08995 [Acidimicrobiia bacterium]|nr:hypothetical protein [Acidimicrobiia bacterium]